MDSAEHDDLAYILAFFAQGIDSRINIAHGYTVCAEFIRAVMEGGLMSEGEAVEFGKRLVETIGRKTSRLH